MKYKQLTRKFINKTPGAIDREIKGVTEFLYKLEINPPPEGQDWVDKMRRHYTRRLIDLEHARLYG